VREAVDTVIVSLLTLHLARAAPQRSRQLYEEALRQAVTQIADYVSRLTKSTLTSLSWFTRSPSRVTKSACQGTKRGTRTSSRSTKSLSQGTKMKHYGTEWRHQIRTSY